MLRTRSPLFLVLCLGTPLLGADLSSKPTHAKPAPLPPTITVATPSTSPPGISPRKARERIEEILRSPCDLDFDNQKTVNFAEVIRQLHERHKISIRLDLGTVYSMSEGFPESAVTAFITSLASEQKPQKQPSAQSGTTPSLSTNAPPTIPNPTQKSPAPPPPTPPVPQTAPSAPPKEQAELVESHPIPLETLSLERMTVADLLQYALETFPVPKIDESMFPMPLTNAMKLDYLVVGDGLVITSRMQALTHKETRVYSIKQLKSVPPEELSKVIRKSIRPWSWREQINDLSELLQKSPFPTSLLSDGVSAGLAGMSISVAKGAPPPNPGPAPTKDKPTSSVLSPVASNSGNQRDGLGAYLANGLAATAHTALRAIEMFHYGEPPTGSLQILPGKLVITQSQAAHREIADLLSQLSEE